MVHYLVEVCVKAACQYQYTELLYIKPISKLSEFCRCDVANREETELAFQGCSEDSRFHGTMHAGGILNDALLARQTSFHVRQVYAPKYYGAHNLMEVRSLSQFSTDALEFFLAIKHCSQELWQPKKLELIFQLQTL